MKLVAERAKYEKFLAELDKDPGSKPANVVARVRADYSTKLQGVLEQLKSNHEVLSSHAATLTTQLQKLQEAEQRLHDEIAEMDLRKQVGEIPEEEWATATERVKADAGKIKQQQDVTAGDIKQIRDMLASVAPAPAPPGKMPTPPATPVVDELAFLKAVVGTGTGSMRVAPQKSDAKPESRTTVPTSVPRPSTIKPIGPPPRPSTMAPARPTTSKPVERLIEPDPMSVESAPMIDASAVAPASRPTPRVSPLIEPPQTDVKITSKVAGEGKPLASNVPTGELNLKAMGFSTSQNKAKCPKCGGPNVPSDWYCVHCGAELAI